MPNRISAMLTGESLDVDLNAREGFGGQSAIMWAAAQRQPAMIKLLAARGVDVNARGVIHQWERKVITEPRPKDMNKGGFTPLLYAAREVSRVRGNSSRPRPISISKIPTA